MTTIKTFDSLLHDMYPMPGTPLKQWVVDQRRNAVNATVERVRADREAAERRQRQAPQWSPYR